MPRPLVNAQYLDHNAFAKVEVFPSGRAPRSASYRMCPPCCRRSATIWNHAAFRAIPSPAPVGTPLIPALPDKLEIGRVRREAARRGEDCDVALAALARQADSSRPALPGGEAIFCD